MIRPLAAALLLTGVVALAAPANAATLIRGADASVKPASGVKVWRGKAPAALTAEAAPMRAAAATCATRLVLVERIGYPPRRLREHGFWSGRGDARFSYGVTTTGFYADRIAAGL